MACAAFWVAASISIYTYDYLSNKYFEGQMAYSKNPAEKKYYVYTDEGWEPCADAGTTAQEIAEQNLEPCTRTRTLKRLRMAAWISRFGRSVISFDGEIRCRGKDRASRATIARTTCFALINLRHPPVRLAGEIDWDFLAGRFSSVCRVGHSYSSNTSVIATRACLSRAETRAALPRRVAVAPCAATSSATSATTSATSRCGPWTSPDAQRQALQAGFR